MGNRMDIVEVAKVVRRDLKATFPDTRFSVRSERYSMGSSIQVEWQNGPATRQVEDVVGKYHGAEFDGMQDLKYSNGRPYGNDFIFCERDVTQEWRDRVGVIILEKFGGFEGVGLERARWDNDFTSREYRIYSRLDLRTIHSRADLSEQIDALLQAGWV